MRILSLYVLFAFLLSCHQDSKDVATEPLTPNDQMVRTKGKKPLRLLTDRPPNLETPLQYFQLDYTPNDVFFVRWHLAGLPSAVDTSAFRLKVNGHVKKELALSLDELHTRFTPYTLTALVQCAGNSRCFFDPQVPGDSGSTAVWEMQNGQA
jgi:DMSO/TMAO reductase YedYZ molybdopterin-dependent catalytic subunit